VFRPSRRVPMPRLVRATTSLVARRRSRGLRVRPHLIARVASAKTTWRDLRESVVPRRVEHARVAIVPERHASTKMLALRIPIVGKLLPVARLERVMPRGPARHPSTAPIAEAISFAILGVAAHARPMYPASRPTSAKPGSRPARREYPNAWRTEISHRRSCVARRSRAPAAPKV
jgi:hypothetical protein